MLIPALGAAPSDLKFGPTPPWLLRAALAMIDLGLVADGDVAGLTAPLTLNNLLDVMTTAASRLCPGELEVLDLELAIVQPGTHRPGGGAFEVEFRAGGVYNAIDVSGVLTTLEAHHEGLGRFAAMTLNEALEITSGPSPPMTPTGAFWMNSHIEWGGELTADSAIDEARDEAYHDIVHARREAEGELRTTPPTEEEIDEHMRPIPTLEDVFGSVPAWAWEPQFLGPHGCPPAFPNPPACLVATAADAAAVGLPGPLRELVRRLVDLAHVLPAFWERSEIVDFSTEGGEVVAWPVVLEWAGDAAYGIVETYDRYAQYCMESGMSAPNTLLVISDAASLARLRRVWDIIVKTDRALLCLRSP